VAHYRKHCFAKSAYVGRVGAAPYVEPLPQTQRILARMEKKPRKKRKKVITLAKVELPE